MVCNPVIFSRKRAKTPKCCFLGSCSAMVTTNKSDYKLSIYDMKMSSSFWPTVGFIRLAKSKNIASSLLLERDANLPTASRKSNTFTVM